MIARLTLPLVAVALQLAAAALALGRPDPGQAAGFFFDYPTVASTLAATQLLVWVLIGIGALWTVVLAIKEVAQRATGPPQRRFWEGSVLVVGILVLLAGAARDVSYQVPMSGGSVNEAQQALGAAHPGGR